MASTLQCPLNDYHSVSIEPNHPLLTFHVAAPMQERLNSLLEKHCETIKNSVGAVGQLLDEISNGASGDPLASVEAAEAIAHQLKGSSGTAGFHDISAAATELDDLLKKLCREDRSNVPMRIGEALNLHNRLASIAKNTTPVKSSLYIAL